MRARERVTGALAGLIAAALVMLSMDFAAAHVRRSRTFLQSRFAALLFSEGPLHISQVLTDQENISMFIHFLGAVTAAYINFDMIPVNEAQTFAVLFESRPGAVRIEDFAYQGKLLTIDGTAADERVAILFLQTLEERAYFRSLSGETRIMSDGVVRFEIVCALP